MKEEIKVVEEKVEKVEEGASVSKDQDSAPKNRNFKKTIPWILLILVLGGLIAWYVVSQRVTETQRNDYTSKIKEAEVSYNAKEYSTAINKYYEATDIIPQRIEAYVGIVDILLMKNRVDDAISIVRESTRSLSSNDKSYLYQSLGDYFMTIQEYDRARQMYQEGLGLGVQNINAQLALARAFLKLGRIDDAKRQLSLSGYSEDNASEANLLLAYIFGIGDKNKAKEQIGKVPPTSKWEAFYDEYDKVLQTLDDDKKYNATKLSRIYINTGYPSLALTVLQPLSEDMTNYLDGMYYMGRAYLDMKEYAKAIETFDKVLTIGGMEKDVFWARARAYYGQNDLDGAMDNYSRALGYAGKDVSEELLTEYVDILLSNNQDLRAVEAVRDVLINVEKPFVYLLGVKSNYQSGEKAKVAFYIQQLDKLELTDVQRKEILYWRARIAVDDENLESAKMYLDELVSLDKYYPRYHFLSAIIKTKEGDVDGAKQSFERCIEYDLNNEIAEEAGKLLSNLK